MAYKNYKIRDNWLDIDKYNDVDIQSVDGVIQTVKVNGEDVGGDYTTANVTIIPLLNGEPITGIMNWNIVGSFPEPLQSVIFEYIHFVAFPSTIIIPSSGYSVIQIFVQTSSEGCLWDGNEPVEITGNAVYTDNILTITGDCTLKLNMFID